MPLRETLNLPNPIPYLPHEAALNVVLTGQMLAKEAARVLRPLGLTDAQFNILILLEKQSDNGTVNQTRLGRMLLVNRSNITGLVDRMEAAGWVKRTAEKGDRRVRQVQLTAAGRRLLKRADAPYTQRVHEVMGHLPRAQCVELCMILEAVRAQLRAPDK